MLVGCGDFRDRLACDADPHDWYGSPTQSLFQADRDGTVSYDPPGRVVTRRRGSFEPSEERFEWTDRYAEGQAIVEGQLFGDGTWDRDGDLDVHTVSTLRDLLGRTLNTQSDIRREGCREVWKVLSSGPGTTVTESTSHVELVADDEVRSETAVREGDGETFLDIDMTAVARADLSESYTLDYVVGDWNFDGQGVDRGDGTGTRDWVGFDTEFDYVGHFDYHFDGSLDHSYDVSEQEVPVARIAYHQTWDGAAVGTWSFYREDTDTWDTCDYRFDDTSCVVDCPGVDPEDC